MNPIFDVRTAYFFLGVLSLVGALGVHASLRLQHRRRHQIWVVGGASFGTALMLVAFRGWVPQFLTFELSHTLLVAGFLFHANALRAELGRGWSGRVILGVLAATSLTYAVLTTLDRGWGLVFNTLATLAGTCLVVASAWAIWRRDRLLPALVIAFGFGAVVVGLLVRVVSLVPSAGQGGPFEPGVTQLLMMLGGLLAVILGHLGYLGLQFLRMADERVSSGQRAAQEAERVRQVREREVALRSVLEERNRLIQRIARSEAASDLALFATSLPHELSQPLCAVKLNIDCLKQGLRQAGEPGMLGVVQAIELSNERVLDLLQQLRILLQTPECAGSETLDLGDLVRRTLPILQGSFREHQIRLEQALPEGRFEVQGSATQLQQLLLILCAHAMDDLRRQPPPPGRAPHVRVSLEENAREVCLRVEDSGVHRGADLRRRTAAEAPAPDAPRRQRGPLENRLGVGLTVAQRVAQSHQGQLEIGDSALGGAAFVLTLPTAGMLRASGQVWAEAITPPPRQMSPS